MIPVLLCLALAAVAFAASWGLFAAGMRAGDRIGETTLSRIEPDRSGEGVWLTVHNPSHHAVLLGASIRRRSLRLWCEAGYFVTVPRRTSQEKLLAGRYAVVCAVAAGETETVLVALSEPATRPAELVVAVGEAHRLRVIHRAVELARGNRGAREGDENGGPWVGCVRDESPPSRGHTAAGGLAAARPSRSGVLARRPPGASGG